MNKAFSHHIASWVTACAVLASVCFIAFAPVPAAAQAQTFKPIEAELDVPIPYVDLKAPTQGENGITVGFLAQYVSGLYQFLIAIVGTVAGVFILIGGFQYLTAGGVEERVAGAKRRITNAVTGLVLAFSSYLILFAINPKLIEFQDLNLLNITPQPFFTNPLDGDVEHEPGPNIPAVTDLSAPFPCPKSGGVNVIQTSIVPSLIGRVAYRLGGNWWNNTNDPKHTASWHHLEQKRFCPDGNKCMDCSGTTNYILRCAGLPYPRGGTTAIFHQKGGTTEDVTVIDVATNSVNGVPLVPGDLIGYSFKENTSPRAQARGCCGHVWMYVGGGKLVETTTSNKGRDPGRAFQTSNFRQNSKFKKVWRVTKAQQLCSVPDKGGSRMLGCDAYLKWSSQ